MDIHAIAKSTQVSLSMIAGLPKYLSTSETVIVGRGEPFGDGIDTTTSILCDERRGNQSQECKGMNVNTHSSVLIFAVGRAPTRTSGCLSRLPRCKASKVMNSSTFIV